MTKSPRIDRRGMTTQYVTAQEQKHCDDYIDDEKAPEALRQYLTHARSLAHGMLTSDPPKLFADHKGKRVRVVMASRFGDVGITSTLHMEYGYTSRVMIGDLSNFGDMP